MHVCLTCHSQSGLNSPPTARGFRDSAHHARLHSAGKVPCSHAQCLHPPHHVAAMRSKHPSSCACNHAAAGRACPLLCPTRYPFLLPSCCFRRNTRVIPAWSACCRCSKPWTCELLNDEYVITARTRLHTVNQFPWDVRGEWQGIW